MRLRHPQEFSLAGTSYIQYGHYRRGDEEEEERKGRKDSASTVHASIEYSENSSIFQGIPRQTRVKSEENGRGAVSLLTVIYSLRALLSWRCRDKQTHVYQHGLHVIEKLIHAVIKWCQKKKSLIYWKTGMKMQNLCTDFFTDVSSTHQIQCHGEVEAFLPQ